MGKKNRRRKDRWDGEYIRDLDGVHAMFPYLMPNRADSEVYIEEQIDVTELVKYLEKKNGPNAEYKTTMFHAFVMALGKTIYQRPLLNRFVSGKRYYQRNHTIMSFIVKRQFQDEAEELLLTMKMDDDMNLEEVSHKILGDSKELKKEDSNNDIGEVLDILKKFPRFLLRFAMMIFRFLDFHGWMPKFICDGDTNYSTVLLSNLGSIKCNAAYHHLNNYGTNSIVITIGKIHKAQVVMENGEVAIRDVMSIGVTADERIADGFYFARSINLLKTFLADPVVLERPIKEDLEYGD